MPERTTADPDQPELFEGLDCTPPRGFAAAPNRRAKQQNAISPALVIMAALLVTATIWAVWMTKSVFDLKAHKAPIASVRLQPLIEEYVQGQARSGTPEELVMRQTQGFMSALDAELARRGSKGETVLVAEAVLSKNVPDITAEVRKAVYARVPAPAGPVQPQAGPAAMPQQSAAAMSGVPGMPMPAPNPMMAQGNAR
jgi:hypothetical protein